jgi:hypothetical protein
MRTEDGILYHSYRDVGISLPLFSPIWRSQQAIGLGRNIGMYLFSRLPPSYTAARLLGSCISREHSILAYMFYA